MIVVVGRVGIDAGGELSRGAGYTALAAAAAGAPVELVGSVGDDAGGDAVMVALGRAGIGHAAVMRDPAAATPSGDERPTARLSRLDASDVELGLRYLPECRVLVLAEPLAADVRQAAAEAAAYHGAALVVVLAAGEGHAGGVPTTATQLEIPAGDDGSFARLIGRFAAGLDAGRRPAEAWADAAGGRAPDPAD